MKHIIHLISICNINNDEVPLMPLNKSVNVGEKLTNFRVCSIKIMLKHELVTSFFASYQTKGRNVYANLVHEEYFDYKKNITKKFKCF